MQHHITCCNVLGPNLAPPPQVMDLRPMDRNKHRNVIHLVNICKFDENGENVRKLGFPTTCQSVSNYCGRLISYSSLSQWISPVRERLDKHSTSCIPCYVQHETSKSSHGREHCDLAWFYGVFQLRFCTELAPPCKPWASCHQMSVQRRPLILVHCCAYGPDRFPLATWIGSQLELRKRNLGGQLPVASPELDVEYISYDIMWIWDAFFWKKVCVSSSIIKYQCFHCISMTCFHVLHRIASTMAFSLAFWNVSAWTFSDTFPGLQRTQGSHMNTFHCDCFVHFQETTLKTPRLGLLRKHLQKKLNKMK